MALNPCARTHRPRLSAPLTALMALALVWIGGGDSGRAQGLDPGVTTAGGVTIGTTTAGAKGAQVYCFMRSTGNSHDVSWVAAYALIKRQSSNLFKTSPEHAAVMITEAVVQNPGSYPDCGKYLGDLFQKAATRDAAPAPAAAGPDSGAPPAGASRRYTY